MTTHSVYDLTAPSASGGTRSAAAWASRLFIFLPMVLLTLVSIRFIVNPAHAAAPTGVTLSTPEAVTNARVTGAFGLTLAVALGFALASPRRLRQGHLLVILFMGLALGIRVFGSLEDGTALATGGERVKTIGEVLLLALNSLGFAFQTYGTKIDLQRRSA